MLWKKGALYALIGFAAGALIGGGIHAALDAGDGKCLLLNLLVGGFYGAVAMGSSVVYEIDEWSILRATVTHFLLVMVLYAVTGLSMGWFRLDEPLFWIIIGIMTCGYVLIWLIQYLLCRRKIRRLNEDLKRWKGGSGRG